MSPLLSPTARISAPSSVPVHPRGAVRGEPHREAPRAQCGTGGGMQRKVSARLPLCCLPLCLRWGQRSTGSLRAGT